MSVPEQPPTKPGRILKANYRPEPKPAAPMASTPASPSWAEQRRCKAQVAASAPVNDEVSGSRVFEAATFATLTTRAIAYTLDMALVWSVSLGVPVIGTQLVHGAHDIGTDLLGTLWTLAWPVLYFGLLTHDGWRTPGMLVVRTRIVRADGTPLPFGAAAYRTILFLAGFFTVIPFLGNWAYMVTGKRQGYHDLLTRSVVVQE